MPKKDAGKRKYGRAIDMPCPKCGMLKYTACGGKYCTLCKEWKVYSEFTRDSKAYDGYNTKCQSCKKSTISHIDPAKKLATLRRYQMRHRERLLEEAKLARTANPEKSKERSRSLHSRYTREQWKEFMLKTRYGLTLAEYTSMVEQQQGKCKICGKVDGKLVVDHKHDETKVVRGLLCPPCNQAIGLFGENVATMLAAVAYLRLDGEYDREQHPVTYQIFTTE